MKTARPFAIIILISCFVPALAQQTYQHYFGDIDDDNGRAIATTADGGTVIAGSTFGSGANDLDMLVIRTDGNGTVLWSNRYGNAGADAAFDVEETSNGDFVVSGKVPDGTGGFANAFLRMDANGTVLHHRTYGVQGNQAYSKFAPLSGGGFLLCGSHVADTFNLTLGSTLVRVDDSGAPIWSRTWSGLLAQEAYDVLATNDGGSLLVGYNRDLLNINVNDGFLIRTDANGDTLWTRAYGSSSLGVYLNSAEQTADGGFILCGTRHGDALLVRVSPTGQLLWNRSYGTSANGDTFNAVRALPDGYLASGVAASLGVGTPRALLIRTDLNGDTLWTRTYGLSSATEAYDLEVMPDGGVLLVGDHYDALNSFDVWVARTDPLGWTGCDEAHAVGFTVTSLPTQTESGPSTEFTVASLVATISTNVATPVVSIVCSGTDIRDVSVLSDVLLFPNPASDQVHVRGIAEVRSITLLDALGNRTVLQPRSYSDPHLELGTFPDGVYTLVMEGSDGLVRPARLMIVH